jgi:hypothetical protein
MPAWRQAFPKPGNAAEPGVNAYRFFFLWRFLRKRFFRLWVAILWRFRFLPQGMCQGLGLFLICSMMRSAPLIRAVSVTSVLYVSKAVMALSLLSNEM